MNNVQVNTFCRLCLIKDETLFDIFDEEGKNLDIQTCLTSIFSIEVSFSDFKI